MSDIKKGDNVSWNWGNGHPEGTVAEVKTSGELAIETKGKHIKVNASNENPAVHVARDGNDVVKRASALTKLDDAGNGDGSTSAGNDDKATGTNGASTEKANETEATNDDKETTDQPTSNGQSESTAAQADESADKMDISTVSTPGEEKVGEKRARDDDDIGDAPSPEEKEEDDATGKEVKKAKLVEEDVEKSAPESTEEPQATTSNTESTGEAPAVEETSPKKKAGRPKKSESQPKEASSEAYGDGTESIAKRTRSKA